MKFTLDLLKIFKDSRGGPENVSRIQKLERKTQKYLKTYFVYFIAFIYVEKDEFLELQNN